MDNLEICLYGFIDCFKTLPVMKSLNSTQLAFCVKYLVCIIRFPELSIVLKTRIRRQKYVDRDVLDDPLDAGSS